MVRETHGKTAQAAPWGGRWMQLAIGIVCMSMIANLQYGWTLFVEPIDDKHGWGRTAIQVAFTIFIVTETWLVPVEGWFVDKFGPRIVVLVGGAMCALSWALNAVADSLALLYLAAVIGGIGAGGVYGTCVGNALKWFPDRRGLAAGLTAAGFGAGSALTVVPIATMIESSGFETTFMTFGLGQGLVILVLACFMTDPPKMGYGQSRGTAAPQRRHYAPQEMLRTPVFWIMYGMFTMVAAGGLMVTAQLGPIAADMGLVEAPVSILGLTLPALTFALSIDRVMNGITRPFFGWVSDHIGRENTMFIAFTIEAVGVMALSAYGADPVAFVILTGLVFFAWGEIFSLFPACCADTFGSRFAATNAGMLYTAKGVAALMVPVGNLMVEATGSWQTVFYSVAIVNALAAFLALFVLKPLRARYVAAASSAAPRLTTRLAD
ncbi:oxalate/formate MFS antiporter [Azospirillum sp. A1-3]|uniref:oxalate/formate MFS antiporter n=1 Tax=Azospirillum sp. A1-3 TaxID=185874 RepID=UPI002076E01D|nr:oxalate/formate MFS antiporter [Azospirillum sp. A1-3]MCM8736560.1 oxalate/formate MFS antiporter [Azospirillum sp. A1-3]